MAGPPDTTDLLVRLSVPDRRGEATRALAARLGVEAVLLFARDPEVGHLVPAAGLPQTLRGGRAWRRFLAGLEAPGRHRGEVDLPQGELRSALALVTERGAAVLLGGAPHADELIRLERLLPLVTALLGLEQRVVIAATEADEARAAADRATALATALEEARAEASRLNADLREEHRRKDDFLAMLAHELRNPLAPLVSAVELLRRRGADGGSAADRQLDVMTRQITHLSRLVEDLVDVARVIHGQVELRRRDVALAEVLADAIESNRPLLDDRRHRVSLGLPEGPVWVHGDPIRLVQVFSNLVHNAAKYSEPDGLLTVTLEEDAGEAVVRVEDRGIGIAPETLPGIFDLFTQAPRSRDRSQGGLGLGLTLVRSLTELHGGEVKAASPGLGEGSVFTVRLPAIAAPEPAAVADRPPPDVAPTGLRVLVVDDNHDAADALAEMLGLMGHHAEVAYSALEALRVAADLDPDLLLLDIGLPQVDGHELARRLRRGGACDGRFVALTGYGSDEDKLASQRAGFDEHVTKPLMMDDLRSILARAARQRGQEAGAAGSAHADEE